MSDAGTAANDGIEKIRVEQIDDTMVRIIRHGDAAEVKSLAIGLDEAEIFVLSLLHLVPEHSSIRTYPNLTAPSSSLRTGFGKVVLT